MSRKGKYPIPLPKGVEVKHSEGKVNVKGPKGTLSQYVVPEIKLELSDSEVLVTWDSQGRERSNFHGLYRSLIENMIKGASEGFNKKLELIGVGYRANVQGRSLNLQLGFSHPTVMEIPEGLEVSVEKNTKVTISGLDKQRVGQFAARIRSKRPPEPYKGKGVRYEGEHVRRKAGKAAAKAK